MSMKKTVLASAIALTLVGAQVATAATSTTGAQFVLDKTEVSAGGTINLALLGLDSNGAVDRFGEASGSVIMAVVSTVKGKINGGSATPGATPTDTNPVAGNFASDVKYVRLVQGNGAVNITYAPDVSGSDTVEIFLQERIPASGGGIEVKQIGQRVTKQVTVNSNSTSPKALWINEFKAAPADAAGMSDATPADGIMGQMTAGVEGGQIIVKAKNANAAGNVTITLTGLTETYTYTANMLQGQAIATLDSKVVKAGTYKIKATFEGFDGSSVKLVEADNLKVLSTGIPRGLKLTASKVRITQAVGQGANVTLQLLDEHGNSTTNRAGSEIKLKLADANEVVSNTALAISVPANSTDGKATANAGSNLVLGDAAGEVLKLGTTSLVATAVDGAGATISTISASDALAVKTVSDTLAATLHADFSAAKLAGTEFNAFTVTVTDGAGTAKATDPGSITIKNMTSLESITVNRNSTTNVVQALMKKATAGTQYLLSDDVENGSLAQVEVTAHGINTAAATKVEMHNAHGEVITSVAPGNLDSASKTYQTKLPEVTFKMFDSFGNKVTGSPITEAITGTFTVTSSNGTVGYSTPEANKGVPGRVSTNGAMVTYAADGVKKFAGKDTIAVNFTKPGLGSNSLNVETTVPALQELKSIKSYIENNEIPVNSQVALTVEVLDQDGAIFVDSDSTKNTVVKVNFNGQEGDTLAPSVTELGGATVASGQGLNFTTTSGRKVFVVDAGSIKGQFSLSFADADGNVTPEVRTFTVTDAVEECSTGTLGGCATEETCADKGGSFVKGANDTNVCKAVPAPGEGGSAGTDKDGNPVTTGAKFGGGASVDSSDFLADKDVNKGKFALIAGNIEVDPAHVGLAADLVVIALHKVTLDGTDHETLYALNDTVREDGNHNFGLWQTDENPGKPGAPADLTAFSSVTALQARHSIQMWNAGLVDQISTFEIQFGYRITEEGDANEGLIVINSTPLKVNIVE